MKTKPIFLMCVLLMAAGLLTSCADIQRRLINPTRAETIEDMATFTTITVAGYFTDYNTDRLGVDEQAIADEVVNVAYGRLELLHARYHIEGERGELEIAFEQVTAAKEAWRNRREGGDR